MQPNRYAVSWIGSTAAPSLPGLIEFFQSLTTLPPSYPADSTPGYSNIAYQILSYALEKLKGKTWFDILNEKVLQPLDLQHTFYSVPNNTREVGLSPGNYSETGWGNQLGEEGP